MNVLTQDELVHVQHARAERQMLCLEGPTDRFAHLCTPGALLEMLAALELSAERVALVHEGKECVPQAYRLENGLCDLAKIEKLMHAGAALLVTKLHLIDRQIWRLSKSLSLAFGVPVNVNVYLSGPNSQGFSKHVDHHDVLVLQVQGQKSWFAAPPTLDEPVVLPDHMGEAPGHAEWETTLNSGQALFLPRGWWHWATGVRNEGSLHLSCGIEPLTAIHFINSLRTRLMKEKDFRRDVPLRGDVQGDEDYVQALRSILSEALSADEVAKFRASREVKLGEELDALEIRIWGDVEEH
ncbi:MAG: cupin domain-containing protein [Myxococcota bacterium]|nr:cupin domain-containing protein [Myxococcota bacterium]